MITNVFLVNRCQYLRVKRNGVSLVLRTKIKTQMGLRKLGEGLFTYMIQHVSIQCECLTLEECVNCEGTGELDCEKCEASEKISTECEVCGGLDLSCEECKGKGKMEIDCNECDGSGTFECDVCYGTGKK